jgi:hypothetical protein
MQVTGGIPLDVGLQDLLLELPDGRRVAIDVASLSQNGRQETYEVRGMVQSWWSRVRFQGIRRPTT